MKAATSVLTSFLETRTSRYNLLALGRLLLVFGLLVGLYSVVFHWLMALEGQDHSWMTGLYWTLTVMSTLGFGDITFHTDVGRGFSLLVLVTGVVFLLVLLPFTFIEFFYAPWMRAQANARAPRRLPPGTKGHVVFTRWGPIAQQLAPMLTRYGYNYFILVPTLEDGLALYDKGLPAVVGELTDPQTYRDLQLPQAAMLVTSRSDIFNTNITFTVREVAPDLPIVATATTNSGRDALELADATLVVRWDDIMGQALARRVTGKDAQAQVIGDLAGLIIAESSSYGTPLVGQTVAEANLRARAGVNLVGIWDHGKFEPARPDTKFGQHTVFLLAGSEDQIERCNRLFAKYEAVHSRVVIVGGGRVGRATARALDERGIEWTLIEKDASRGLDPARTIVGDAAELEVMVAAGIRQACSVIITPHDDDVNIFLTLLYRRLRANLQILVRCTHDNSVGTLHRAGADLVLSYGSMMANIVFNVLRPEKSLLMAEGINVFSNPIPASIAGKSLAEAGVRPRTGCTIIAIQEGDVRTIGPSPDHVLPAGGKIVLIGSLEAEEKFLAAFA